MTRGSKYFGFYHLKFQLRLNYGVGFTGEGLGLLMSQSLGFHKGGM
jgi:hypothetical protein